MTVRVRYQTIEFGEADIHVRTLRDLQEFNDDDGEAEAVGIYSATWSLFGVVWGAGHALAHLMADYSLEKRRILEVGCGIGLASLVLNDRRADISATDLHPEAGSFLAENVALNGGPKIPFTRAGWGDLAGGPEDEMGRFDLIIGSDVLYEAGHAAELSAFIERHANPTCEVLLVDPGRGHQGRFKRCMAALGYTASQGPIVDVPDFKPPFTGRWLRYAREALPAA
jgi:predicted nicotinamide N-methyase